MRHSLFLVLLWLSCSCTTGERDIRNYYFPLRELEDGLVYEYAPVGAGSLGSVYWYYRSFIFPDSVLLSSTYYEGALVPLQHVQEHMVSNGMQLTRMFIYEDIVSEEKAQYQIPLTITAGDVFPFEVEKEGGVFIQNVEWESRLDSGAIYRVIKNRRFSGDTSFVWQGKKKRAVMFELKEQVEYDQNGVFEQAFDGLEVYAKGLGLVYFRKEINPDLTLEYRLEDRFPMTELERRFKQQYFEQGGEE